MSDLHQVVQITTLAEFMKGEKTLKVQLQGFTQVDFVSDSGERVEGANLYVTHPDPDITGNFAGKIFVRKNITIPQGTKPGDELDMQFTSKGKLVSIVAVK